MYEPPSGSPEPGDRVVVTGIVVSEDPLTIDDGRRIVRCPPTETMEVRDERGERIEETPKRGEVVRVFGVVIDAGEDRITLEPHAVQRLNLEPELWRDVRRVTHQE